MNHIRSRVAAAGDMQLTLRQGHLAADTSDFLPRRGRGRSAVRATARDRRSPRFSETLRRLERRRLRAQRGGMSGGNPLRRCGVQEARDALRGRRRLSGPLQPCAIIGIWARVRRRARDFAATSGAQSSVHARPDGAPAPTSHGCRGHVLRAALCAAAAARARPAKTRSRCWPRWQNPALRAPAARFAAAARSDALPAGAASARLPRPGCCQPRASAAATRPA